MGAESTESIQIPADRIPRLLNMLALPTTCTACGKKIWFLHMHKSGKSAPFTEQGISHYADCSKAADFRKGGERITGVPVASEPAPEATNG